MKHIRRVSRGPARAIEPGEATTSQIVAFVTDIIASLATFFLGKEANYPNL